VPFLAGALLLGMGLFIRLHILESQLFEKAKAERNANVGPLVELLRAHPRNLALAIGARFAENACFYIFTVFIFAYASEERGFTRNSILVGVLLASGLQLFTIPAFAALSDRLGRRPVYLAGALFLGLFAFPFFWLVDSGVPILIWLALILGLTAVAAMYGPQAAFFSELFGTHVRYTGASLGSQLAAPLAGGMAPLIATALLSWSAGQPWPIALYIIVMVLITFCSVFLASETVHKDLSS
jgi:MFS family permease